MRKIIFLDVDGVLNNESTTDRSPKGFVGVDDILLERLKSLVEVSNAEVVLTSSWKEESEDSEDWIYLVNRLKEYGISILDTTDDLGRPSLRGAGIIRYLHNDDVTNYVVLDDFDFDFYCLDLYSHFVWTDPKFGLTDENVSKALEILDGKLDFTLKDTKLDIELGYQHG